MVHQNEPRVPELAPTGVPRLDEVLGGGFVRRQVHLVLGSAGTGKTTLALQFLLEGIRRGERGLFVSFSETREELEMAAAAHGLVLDDLVTHEPGIFHEANLAEEDYSIFHPREVELGEAMDRLLERVEEVEPRRAVFDPVSALRLMTDHPLRYRRQVMALRRHFIGRDCTVLLLDDRMDQRRYDLDSLVHSILHLEQNPQPYGEDRRRVRVVKHRGVDFFGGHHDVEIRTGGLVVYPRVRVRDASDGSSGESVSSGLDGLDVLLGGGPTRGSSTLIMGPAGTGKSTLCGFHVAAAAARAEPAVVFSFEEATENYVRRMESLGISLREPREAGRVRLHFIQPAQWSGGELAHRVQRAVSEDGARHVVFDSLNGYLRAMPDALSRRALLRELLAYLSVEDVVTLMTATHHGVLGAELDEEMDATYLADAILLLRHFEAAGSVRQAVSVVKKRTGHHERTIHEFRIGRDGIEVGPPLEDFHGVLTGVPTYGGESGSLMRRDGERMRAVEDR